MVLSRQNRWKFGILRKFGSFEFHMAFRQIAIRERKNQQKYSKSMPEYECIHSSTIAHEQWLNS